MSAMDRIEEEIRYRGWTPVDFCQKFGITPHHWNFWEQQGLPNDQISKVADYLQLSPEWINEGSGPRHLAELKPGSLSNTAPSTSINKDGIVWAFQFMDEHISDGLVKVRGLEWKAKIFKLLYEAYVEGHGKIAHAGYKAVLRSIGL